MAIADRKERERHEMKDRILQAAVRLFVSEGFAKTTIRAIASSIEYSPSTIYLYFKDKQEILTALFHQFATALYLALRTAGEAVPIDKRLSAIGLAYVTFALENPEQYELMFMIKHEGNVLEGKSEQKEALCIDEETGKVIESAHDDSAFIYLQESILKCIDHGSKPRYDIYTSALIAWSAVHGIVSLHIRNFLDMYPKEYLHQMIGYAIESINVSLFEEA